MPEKDKTNKDKEFKGLKQIFINKQVEMSGPPDLLSKNISM